MKKLLLFLPFVLIAYSLAAKELVDGFVVFSTNDTLVCKIKIPKDLDLFSEVSVIDSFGKKGTFRPQDKEIKSFGFHYQDVDYRYAAKADEHKISYFFLIKDLGPKLNLYYRYTFNSPVGGGASYRSDVFMLEDPDNRTVTVKGGLFSSYQRKIKFFLKDDPALSQAFEKKVMAITDIPDFVQESNKL